MRYMDNIAAKLDFNQGAFARFTALLKDSLDLNGVLSTRKSGIWNSAGSELGSRPEKL